MEPVSPVLPGLSAFERVFAANQSQYTPLPAIVSDTTARRVTSRWKLNDEERAFIASGGDLLVTQLTGGHDLQPIFLQVITGVEETVAALRTIPGPTEPDDVMLPKGLLEFVLDLPEEL